MAMIDELLPKAMLAVGAIPKGQRNRSVGYVFRGVDDALGHCNGVLAELGISLGVRVRNHRVRVSIVGEGAKAQRQYHARLSMVVSFHAPDGSQRANVLAGEALDYNGDKATTKAMAAAFKYGLFFGLCIPVERQAVEDSDRDSEPPPVVLHHVGTRNSAVAVSKPADEPVYPADSASVFSKALAAVGNAHTIDHLNKLMAEVERRVGEFTSEQYAKLEAAAAKRIKQFAGNETVTAVTA